MNRRRTRPIMVGPLPLGGGAPVSVQTMATADPHDAVALADEIRRCAEAGADIVRLAVPDAASAETFAAVRRSSPVPLVADIHFDHRLALAALAAGCDALRVNPGNIGGRANVQAVARAAKERGVPIRIGVNGGSLERDLLAKWGDATADALVESAMRHVAMLEGEGFRDIAISVKASDVRRTLAAYRMLAERTDCPLHLGVTEAGTLLPGTVRSSVALGILLSEGIGDTVRVSLTDTPEREVQVALEILRSLGLRPPGASVTSCPTCGRTQVDVARVASEVEEALSSRMRAGVPPVRVAVMGCVVNGPGEARGADVALCGGKGDFIVYVRGEVVGRVPAAEAAAAAMEQVDRLSASSA
ncbi:MAG: flavodoxin-dependent (E)-4-hydroxy-3-methylbut-2-enyl-diphosphate synthase [Kiritimatiellae bacterium]|nr:flavodoxin-dependent (E)-4-hydroxy-3-methylbut-2-enyl-diphosphate synthase [Kiritimatiellia bacterium]